MLNFFALNTRRLYFSIIGSLIVCGLAVLIISLSVSSTFIHIIAIILAIVICVAVTVVMLRELVGKIKRQRLIVESILYSIDEVIMLKDEQGNILFSNQVDSPLTDPEQQTEKGKFQFPMTMEAVTELETITDIKTGKSNYFQSTKIPYLDIDNQLKMLVVSKDLTEIRQLTESAGKNKARLEQVLAVSGEGLWEWNMKTGQVLHNDQWVKLTGIGRSDNTFSEFEGCIFENDRPKVMAALDNLIKHNQPYNMKYRMKRPDGKVIWIWDRGRIAEFDDDGSPIWIVGLILDVTQEQENEQRISNLAYFDQLTGLTNRTQLEIELEKLVHNDNPEKLYSALLLLDLDRFKLINDGYGHYLGDSLLYQVAKRLESITMLPATHSRFGGDEFVILLPNVHQDKEEAHRLADQYAQEVISLVEQSFVLESEIETVKIEYNITVSIGGVTFCSNETDKDTLLKVADVALNRTKSRGGHSITILGDEEKNHLADKTELYQSLIDSNVSEEFFIHLQPKYNLQQKVIGAEALVRWNHPTKGFLTPWAFIEMAEENNVILAIGRTVLEQGCTVLKQWQSNPATKDLILSLNVSAKQIWQSMFAEDCIELVKSYDIDPSKLTLELTESVLIQDLDDAISKLNKLRDYGIQISLDDFGTGFSSLSYLRQLPIDELKIDQSFVRNLTEDASSQLLVKSIINLAENFDLQIVAEGVETIEHFNMLKELGVPLHQGYYFSKPISREDFAELLLNDDPASQLV